MNKISDAMAGSDGTETLFKVIELVFDERGCRIGIEREEGRKLGQVSVLGFCSNRNEGRVSPEEVSSLVFPIGFFRVRIV